jgi:ComF family protein
MVLRLKHRSSEGLGELMGELFALQSLERLSGFGAEMIVPIPQHWWRRLCRGYNQSEALARGMGKRLRLPVVASCLRRTRRTLPQVSLTRQQRKENVRGAFAPRNLHLLQNRTILLVDDVMTTGATVHEAAKALRNGGASRVVVATLTRAKV